MPAKNGIDLEYRILPASGNPATSDFKIGSLIANGSNIQQYGFAASSAPGATQRISNAAANIWLPTSVARKNEAPTIRQYAGNETMSG